MKAIPYADYYPFGMLMPNRHGSDLSASEQYKYGYQGSEKDGEVHGESYTTHFRQLDTRIGRWLSLDPSEFKFAWQSPYVSMDNNPIALNDPPGDEVIYDKIGKGGLKQRIKVAWNWLTKKEFRKDYNIKRDDEVKFHLTSKKDATRLREGGDVQEYSSDNLSDKYKSKNKLWYYGKSHGDIPPPCDDCPPPPPRFNFDWFPKRDWSDINWPKINFPKLGWGAFYNTSNQWSINLISWGLGDYEDYTCIGVPRFSDFWLNEFKVASGKPFIGFSWYTKNGHYNFISIGQEMKLFGRRIRFTNKRYKNGRRVTTTPWG